MKETILGMMFFFVLILGVIAWKSFEYNECRKVGHSALYCMTRNK